jgi:hypothetical protein
MDIESVEVDEIEQTVKKKVLNEEVLKKYSDLEQRIQRKVKDLFNKKYEFESDQRFKSLFTSVLKNRKTPMPEEEKYLTQIISYFYDYMNGVETMSFETIENL